MRSRKFIKFVILFAAFAVFSFSYAQTEPEQEITSPDYAIPQSVLDALQTLQETSKAQLSGSITLKNYPSTPAPLEKVTLVLQSLGPDLNSSYITWIVNGTVLKAGNGIKILETVVGKAGTVTGVQVIITAQNGLVIEKALTLQPAGVDLVWEAEAYTPPFYKGKTLYVAQGQVKITAIPDIVERGAKINSKNLIYKWKKGGNVLESLSGYGKDSITLNGGIITKPIAVSVEISSLDGKARASQEILIKISNTKVVLYENNPLYGIKYNAAITNEVEMEGKEITIIAIPYFFSGYDSPDSGLSHMWSLNKKTIQDQKSNMITFRAPDGEGGISSISLGIESRNKILQSARESVIVKFGQSLDKVKQN